MTGESERAPFETVERLIKPAAYIVTLVCALVFAGWAAKGLLPVPDHAAALASERRFTMLEAETKAQAARQDRQEATLRELRDWLMRGRPPTAPQAFPWLDEPEEVRTIPAVVRR